MKRIPLSQNKVAFVDDEDFDRFSHFSWAYRAEPNRKGYAVRSKKVGKGKYTKEYLHRAIMAPPPTHTVIFLNHDGLDCRRENLKVVTKTEANRHHRVRYDSKSGIKGVKFNSESQLWEAAFIREGHTYRVGSFRTSEKAAQEYERAVKEWDERNQQSR